MLLGRTAECEQLVSLLDHARRGTSSVLVLTGEPGVGKSALLDFAREQSDGLVLSAVGAETESEIPYAALADVFRPVVDQIGLLPTRQADALSGAFALGPAKAGDRFGIAAATLSLLGALASSRPVLVMVDDAQWIDYFSCEALAFTANRLEAEGITLLVSMREGATTQAAFGRHPVLDVRGLDDTAAHELIRSRSGGDLGPAVTRRLVAEAGGNPLALGELPSLLSAEELALWSRGLEPIPIDSRLQQAFSEQVRYLPVPTQQALLLVATLGSVPYEVVEAAMAGQGLATSVVDAAEQAGLIVEREGRWAFRHPLMRAAVYRAAPPSQRRRAHLAAASALENRTVANALERRSWHLVSAGESSDESIARTLEEAAEDELSRSNFAVASKLFERSAQLATLEDQVGPRLLRAADSARLAGAIEDTQRLLVQAREMAQGPELTVATEYYLSRLEIWRGSAPAGRDTIVDLAALVAPVNAEVAAQMLSDAALASMEIGDVALAAETSARALELLGDSEIPLATVAVRALVLGLQGDMAPAHDLLSAHATGFDAADPVAISQPSSKRSSANDQLSLVAALAHLGIEEADRAGKLLERAVTTARDHTAIGVLPFRLGRLAWVQYWQGRWSASRSSAAEALLLAEDTGWVAERPNSLAAMARIEAAMGLAEDCRRHAQQATEAANSRGTRPNAMYARAALGLLELSLGNDSAAVGHLEPVADFAEESGLTDNPLLWWSADLVEAYARQDRHSDAERVLARLEAGIGGNDRPVAAAVLARSRAILDPASFERHLTEALGHHERSTMPFEHARTQLRLGVHLRRQRLRGEAQTHLEAALDTFERLGAAPWRDRARGELEASGVHVGERPADLANLTPQEFQVAQNVARGMSNREIAAAMFLSVKTIEFHLGNTFHKLDVHRRSQLAILVSQHDRAPVTPIA